MGSCYNLSTFLFIFGCVTSQFHLSNGLLGPIVIPKQPSPYALSPTYLEYLSQQERKIYSAMKNYEKELEHRLTLVQKYVRDYEKSSILGTTSLGERASTEEKDKVIAQHPILSYRMLSRYANEFQAIGEHISQNAEQVSSDVVRNAQGAYEFPKSLDADDAIASILRMQYMYELRSSDIAEGKIPGLSLQTAVKLTNQHCYNIAKTAQIKQYYTLALEWFDTLKIRLQNENGFYNNEDEEDEDEETHQETLNKTMVEQDIFETIAEHNRNYAELYDEGHEYIFTKRIRSKDGPRPATVRQMVTQNAVLNLTEDHPNYYQTIYAKHIALCNGATFQSNKELSKLKCWQDSSRNPFWRIRPLKIELVNINPQIIQIHDIIPDNWISHLKKLAYSELERAPNNPEATPRTAAYSWFKDGDLLPQVPISKRIELITGLNVVGLKASEALQVAAYAFGGHVELHYDSKGPNDEDPDPKGDRVTTFLVYLNDLTEGEIGGRTAFPKLGFAIKPSKGSAVLWYTNMKNLGVDNHMLHSACPLITGHKWIATKWTHQNENIFKRPCGLSPQE